MILKTLALIGVAALGALLIYAATRPDSFHVQRTTRVQAPPDRIHALIDDLQRFNTWNPYLKKDPAMKSSYPGTTTKGPGASFAFAGNKQVGKGSMRIIESTPAERVTMALDMIEPMQGHNTVEFKLAPQGSATDVTWSIQGASPFISKLFGIFIDMDRMIGRDFETGLADLKAIAERG